jgi:hypothetical protein
MPADMAGSARQFRIPVPIRRGERRWRGNYDALLGRNPSKKMPGELKGVAAGKFAHAMIDHVRR